MRRKIFLTLAMSSLAASTGAWAQTADQEALTTRTTEEEVTSGYLKNEVVGIKPQAGVMTYNDAQGDGNARAILGLTVDANLMPMLQENMKNWYLGPSTGVLFSHVGEPGSNLFGTNPTTTAGAAGANLLLIPANLKVGYNLTDTLRLSAHGGGNLIYRSVANSLALGASSATSGSTWNLFPNVGADAEFGIGKNMALMVRPDLTLTPGNSIFTGTVALSVPLG